ncbi:SAV_6107 family HEPN domain-containing protein [Pseudonocardia nematodicida]|uniref:SAV_6107 family HEPN domain-containing protein n=1 Tax=Pseudonocardia nematodicida TaxID=1206997 RepID=A0ABV1KF58_9PSEU
MSTTITTMELDLDLGLPAARVAAGGSTAAGRATGRGAVHRVAHPVLPLHVGGAAGGGAGRTRDAAGPATERAADEAPAPAVAGPAARVPDPRRGCSGGSTAAGSGTGRPARPTGRAAPGRRPVPPPSRDALALLRQAADQLAEAHRQTEPVRRYPAAYLAALRAGAAVLAMRARPRPRRGAPRDVWRLLTEVAPELEEWAAFFASCSRTRAAAEAGIERLVDRRGADDLLRQAEQFVTRVQQLLPR